MKKDSPHQIKLNVFTKSIIPKYLENVGNDIILLEDAFKKRDRVQIEKISHKIKGSSSSYGLEYCSELAQEIVKESRTDDPNLNNIEYYLSLLKNHIQNLDIEYIAS